ncbi:serine/threonine protein kinase with WD40 repeats [Ectocarpus siliculosus]|uniref:Serine/threonine protein kinase with WD40 repeats n=1 Tax=Ectocarpus siliculosus TaxID=2880 RepID=D7FX33_ECTSI|nr:serine/threonine protein kinase with WD40 repeats [Ectocarpus siliculosus]|eukprot:CBJ26366.1 serine/threonine protein kinase with WD40 repeats [Ectocarpus siliculosus]
MASSAFPQKWREKLERGQPSGPREVHGRRREALEDGRSEAEARWSGDGERLPCLGCLAKEAELAEAIESLELVQLRSRAAVDRCNEQQAELERREEHTLELQKALEAKKSEVLRIELQISLEETKSEALRLLQVCLQQLQRENAALRAQAAGRASSSAAAGILQSLAAATATATTTAAGGGVGAEQGVVAVPPRSDDLGAAFVRRQLEDACAKAVFAQRALDPERGLLQMADELGAGGHGTVRKAVDPTTGKTFAVKTANDEEGKTCLKHEAKNLIRLGTHEGVVEVMAILDKDNSMAIAMELGQTDLQHAMFDQKRTVVELLTYAAQVADGVDFMHSKGLVHGDLKPDNVLLVKKTDTLTVAKLADLGLSRAVGERKYRGCGTLGNSITPNNFFRAVPADKADDVWALGVLLLSLLLPRGLFSSNFLTSRVLHTAAEREALARSTTSRQRLEIKYGMSFRTANDTSENGFQKRMVRSVLFVTLEQTMRDTACSFLRRMVDPDASERPDIGEVRAWLPSIIQSAERQSRAMATAGRCRRPGAPWNRFLRSPLPTAGRGASPFSWRTRTVWREDTRPEGDDISVPDSWMPSDDGSSLALAVGAATSGQDGVAHDSGPEDASFTISGVSTIDVVGTNSSVDTSQHQGALSSNACSVRLFSGAEGAGASNGLLPLLSGGECSTSGSRQSRGGEGEETVDAEGWSEPVVTGGASVEGIDGNGNEDAGTLSAVDVTLTLTPAVPAMVAEEGPTGGGTFDEDWGVGGESEYLGNGEWGEAAAAAATATGPRQRRRLGIFMKMISEVPAAAATAAATAGAAGASPTMTTPPPIVQESFAFEGVSTLVGQECWVLGREMTVAGGCGAGIDLSETAVASLSQEVFDPEVNMSGQCGDERRRRGRLPCFASFH